MNTTDTTAMLKDLERLDDLVRSAETLADELRLRVRQIERGCTGLESRLVQIEAMLRDTKRATACVCAYVKKGRRLKETMLEADKIGREDLEASAELFDKLTTKSGAA